MILTERDMAVHLKDTKMELIASLQVLDFSERTIGAIEQVPRELFVDPNILFVAYEDSAQGIPGYEGRSSISQPFTVAMMTELLDVQPDELVIEVGTATGYQAAILSHLARRVISIEIDQNLATEAKKRLQTLHRQNVDVVVGDANWSLAIPESADKLIITASIFPSLMSPVFDLLKPGGLCVCPVGGVNGENTATDLMKFKKEGQRMTVVNRIPKYSFVPLEGKTGWSAHLGFIVDQHNKHFHASLTEITETRDRLYAAE